MLTDWTGLQTEMLIGPCVRAGSPQCSEARHVTQLHISEHDGRRLLQQEAPVEAGEHGSTDSDPAQTGYCRPTVGLRAPGVCRPFGGGGVTGG